MKTKVSRLGFAFGNGSNDVFNFEYICTNKKNSFTWGIGSEINSFSAIKTVLNKSVETNCEIPNINESALKISQLKLGEMYSVKDIIVVCIKHKSNNELAMGYTKEDHPDNMDYTFFED